MRVATFVPPIVAILLNSGVVLATELPDEIRFTIGGVPRRLQRRAGSPAAPMLPALVMGHPVWPVPPKGDTPLSGIHLPAFPQRLIIVTTEAVVDRSAVLQDYVDWRSMGGWEVIVGLETDWDLPTPRDHDDRPARIRAWLKQIYAEYGAGYLLLIGDPDPEGNGIPMRRTQPLGDLLYLEPESIRDSLADVPTDHYYADLTSDWDCDADGVFGEYPDDSGVGCADWGPELIVGRIPVYRQRETERLDGILATILAYEQAAAKSYRDTAIFAGAFGGFRGQSSPGGESSYDEDDDLAVFLDRTAADLTFVTRAEPLRLYEDDGILTSAFEHERSLSGAELIAAWQQGASTVSWGGHGSSVSSHRQVWVEDSDGDGSADDLEVSAPAFITSDWADVLEDAPPAVVHMMSCLNGFPEEPDNLGFALLGRGAIATAAASRSAVGISGTDWEPRPELATATTASYYFTLLVQAGHRFGDALAYTKWGLPGDGWAEYAGSEWYDFTGYAWLTKLEYNLYGDPTQRLDRCLQDSDCDDALPCTGVESCQLGYCVHSDPIWCETGEAVCTSRRCLNETGECAPALAIDGTRCDDGLWCTTGDTCAAGACQSEPRVCPGVEGYQPGCDDVWDECILVPDDEGEVDPNDGAPDLTPIDDSPTGQSGCRALVTNAHAAGLVFLLMLRFAARRNRRVRHEEGSR